MAVGVPILYGMTRRAKDIRPDPATGRALKAQRVRVGLTQEQVVELSGGLLYPRLLSELETGKRAFTDLSVEQAMVYLRILQYTPQGIQADSLVDDRGVLSLPHAEEYDPTLEIPQYGDVAAGLNPGSYEPDTPPFRIDPNIPELRGRPVGKLAVMRVNGDSMVSPKVSQSIPKGARIVVEMGAAPAPGDTVVAWIRELELSVLKKMDEEDEVILSSLNPNGPVFRASEYDIEIRGVARLVMKKP